MQDLAASVDEISSTECFESLKNTKNAYLIDIRDEEEWQETGIADLSSINKKVLLISWVYFSPHAHHNSEFLSDINKNIMDKKADLFFICKSGGRSLQASNAAKQYGYNNCYSVKDGFIGNMLDNNLNPLNLNGWVNVNLPWRKL